MIETLLRIGVNNAVAASLLAVLACCLARVVRRPPVVHALWLIVLVKLITPPLYHLEFTSPWAASRESAITSVAASGADAVTMPDDKDRLASATVSVRTLRSEAGQSEYPIAAIVQDRIAYGLDATGLVDESNVDWELPQVDELGTSAAGESSHASATPVQQNTRPSLVLPAFEHDPDSTLWPPSLSSVLPTLLIAVWLVGTMAWLALAAWRLHRFAQLVRRARPADNWLQADSERLARLLGSSSSPRVRVANVCVSPLVWSSWKGPVILLPSTLLARLDRRQVSALLTHELAHVRRGDHFVRWLEIAVLACYWWFPVAWSVRRRLRQAEEDCCDAWVAWALPEDRHAYATAVLESVELLSARPAPLPVAASGLASVTLLQRRLEMILHGFHGPSLRRLSSGARLALCISAVLVLPLSAQVTGDTDEAPAEGVSEVSGSESPPSDAADDSGDVFAKIAASEAVSEATPPSADSVGAVDLFDAAVAEPGDLAIDVAEVVDASADTFDDPLVAETSRFDVGATADAMAASAPPLAGQTFVAEAKLSGAGEAVELMYQVRRPVVEQFMREDGRRVSQKRWIVEHRIYRVPFDQIQATIVGQGEPSAQALRSRLRSGRTVVVAPGDSDVANLLRDGTLVLSTIPDEQQANAQPALVTVTADAAFDPTFPPPGLASDDAAQFDAPTLLHAEEDHLAHEHPRLHEGANANEHADEVAYDAHAPVGPAFSDQPAEASRTERRGWPVPHTIATTTGNIEGSRATAVWETARQPIVLQMDRDGNVLVLGQKTPLDRLAAILQAMSFLNGEPELGATVQDLQQVEVVLALPESVSASHAVKLIEICKEAGFERLRLQVSQGPYDSRRP